MEYLRDLPSKTDAFTAATYERVRHEPGHVNRPYISTTDKGPKYILTSSDENLVLEEMRRKKAAEATRRDPVGFPPTPSLSSIAPTSWDTSEVPPSSALERQQQQRPGESQEEQTEPPQRVFKRPRIALSNAAAAAAAVRANSAGSSSSSSTSSRLSTPLPTTASSSSTTSSLRGLSPSPYSSRTRVTTQGSSSRTRRPLS
ncbi:hypothetical protein BGZ83_000583 [Gryganskiella cystojenkinii]|nr:hypothetical protein BGZ83_000583 [Gryganskiella cystojenkinii]